MVHDAGHEISYDYDGDLDMSNIPNVDDIFSHSNEDNSIGKIGNKIMNLILCTFLHCIVVVMQRHPYYTSTGETRLLMDKRMDRWCKGKFLGLIRDTVAAANA